MKPDQNISFLHMFLFLFEYAAAPIAILILTRIVDYLVSRNKEETLSYPKGSDIFKNGLEVQLLVIVGLITYLFRLKTDDHFCFIDGFSPMNSNGPNAKPLIYIFSQYYIITIFISIFLSFRLIADIIYIKGQNHYIYKNIIPFFHGLQSILALIILLVSGFVLSYLKYFHEPIYNMFFMLAMSIFTWFLLYMLISMYIKAKNDFFKTTFDTDIAEASYEIKHPDQDVDRPLKMLSRIAREVKFNIFMSRPEKLRILTKVHEELMTFYSGSRNEKDLRHYEENIQWLIEKTQDKILKNRYQRLLNTPMS